MARPTIAITADLEQDEYSVGAAYVRMVVDAGGVPAIIPPLADLSAEQASRYDGYLFTGGADIDLRDRGVPLHPRACVVDPRRQRAELALLEALRARPEAPVLGICLGMQMMGVHGGARLEQHLPDALASASAHGLGSDRLHPVSGEWGNGEVASHHHQALADAGPFLVTATAPDGVIEGIRDPKRRFYVGVQWHPERTRDRELGLGVFRRLVAAARGG